MIAVVLVVARLAGDIASRLKQPPVLGELLVGIALGAIPWSFTKNIASDPSVDLLAQLGVLILLFEVGLHSTVRDLLEVGGTAARVALLGTVASFAFGFLCAIVALPNATRETHVFIAASITATSIGITARVFKDLGLTRSEEARTILGAAVLDDVLGLVVLALVAGWIRNEKHGGATSSLALAWLFAKTLGLLAIAVALGVRVTPRIFAVASRLRAPGVLLSVGLSFCFLFAWAAEAMGLAPIIGAFAAGLVLEELHAKPFVARGEKSLDDLIAPISDFLAPIFFVVMGMRADVLSFANPRTIALASALTVAAVLGKVACALGVKRGVNRLAVAIGMIPRGEVTLIFASLGTQLDVLGRDAYSAIVVVVVLTTVLTPAALKWRLAT